MSAPAAQGLQGLHPPAAQGLQLPAAHGLQGLHPPAAHGLQLPAAHGLQGLHPPAAHGLQLPAAQGLQGLHPPAAQGLQLLAAHGLQGLHPPAAQGLHGLHGLQLVANWIKTGRGFAVGNKPSCDMEVDAACTVDTGVIAEITNPAPKTAGITVAVKSLDFKEATPFSPKVFIDYLIN